VKNKIKKGVNFLKTCISTICGYRQTPVEIENRKGRTHLYRCALTYLSSSPLKILAILQMRKTFKQRAIYFSDKAVLLALYDVTNVRHLFEIKKYFSGIKKRYPKGQNAYYDIKAIVGVLFAKYTKFLTKGFCCFRAVVLH
jgi:hypothetical protein